MANPQALTKPQLWGSWASWERPVASAEPGNLRHRGRENGPVVDDLPAYGGFHSHGGTPIAGWLISWKIPSING